MSSLRQVFPPRFLLLSLLKKFYIYNFFYHIWAWYNIVFVSLYLYNNDSESEKRFKTFLHWFAASINLKTHWKCFRRIPHSSYSSPINLTFKNNNSQRWYLTPKRETSVICINPKSIIVEGEVTRWSFKTGVGKELKEINQQK